MQLVTLSCNNCGAPIDVPQGANYVTCAHCGSRLAVRRSSSAIYTEVLGKIDQRTSHMAQDLEAIRTESELAEIDREWQLEREEYLAHGGNGSIGLPTTARLVGIIIVALVIIIFAIYSVPGGFTRIFGVVPVPGGFIGVFGALMIVAAIVYVVVMLYRKSKYDEAEAAYRSKRDSVLRRRKK